MQVEHCVVVWVLDLGVGGLVVVEVGFFVRVVVFDGVEGVVFGVD